MKKFSGKYFLSVFKEVSSFSVKQKMKRIPLGASVPLITFEERGVRRKFFHKS